MKGFYEKYPFKVRRKDNRMKKYNIKNLVEKVDQVIYF